MNAPVTEAGWDLAEAAAVLDAAATGAAPVAQLTATAPLGLDAAYDVQRLLIERRTARGERPSGVKLGFTSRTKAAQMGVFDVIFGRLTDAMRLPDGARISLDAYVHPRVEPEVAFRLAVDVGPGDTVDPEAAVDAVAPALEIIDSRYRDFRFTLEDVVADNTSAAGYVLGPWIALADAGDLANRGVRLEIDGRTADTGSTAAILGHPLRAVHAALRRARELGHPLRAGDVLLAGAATPAVALTPGSHIEATVTGLGRAAFTVADATADGATAPAATIRNPS
ncbi:2-keto-4-pentenoate hydratase [Streptomyces catenulae]|uniref:Fumarylacetoacetate hydrolase family protein n=1 Tax=Streptomyces catenulae TaxID=66875 RepID=A0ABV2Z4Q9_9ACTN|nr:fumarylacetoacetate hydrolase family protein [Streptomyces catenulae]